MQKPLQLPGRAAKRIMRIMVGGFIAIGVAMVSFILITWYKSHKAKVSDLEMSGAVVSIHQPDRRKTKWAVATLTDGKSTVMEDAMLGLLQVGDSLFKKKGEDYFTVKKPGSGKVTRIRIIQP